MGKQAKSLWCNGRYQEIIAFEPDRNNYKIAEQNCKEIRNFRLYPYATGAKSDKAYFNMGASSGSKIDALGNEEIIIESIDNILNGREATFIKMDVEGAELESLKGTRKTIVQYKPKLAICIYHKLEDFYKIPEFIMSCFICYLKGVIWIQIYVLMKHIFIMKFFMD